MDLPFFQDQGAQRNRQRVKQAAGQEEQARATQGQRSSGTLPAGGSEREAPRAGGVTLPRFPAVI